MTAILCSLSSGLDDLPRARQRDVAVVLRVLKARGRFSVFEATANDTIARTMTNLCHKGILIVSKDGTQKFGKLIETDNSCGYPWTKVRLTEDGERFLAASEPTP